MGQRLYQGLTFAPFRPDAGIRVSIGGFATMFRRLLLLTILISMTYFATGNCAASTGTIATTTIRWADLEPKENEFRWDLIDRIASNDRLSVQMEGDATPTWVYHKSEAPFVVCMEHHKIGGSISPWSKRYADCCAHLGRALAQHCVSNPMLQVVRLDFRAMVSLGSNVHRHPGLWAGDALAHNDFGLWLVRLYGGNGPFRDAWGEMAGETAYVYPFTHTGAPGFRQWLDLCNWYGQSRLLPALAAIAAFRQVNAKTTLVLSPPDEDDVRYAPFDHLSESLKRLNCDLDIGSTTGILQNLRTSSATSHGVSVWFNEASISTLPNRIAVCYPESENRLFGDAGKTGWVRLQGLVHAKWIAESDVCATSLAKVDTLILPNARYLELRACDAIRVWVRGGGRLILAKVGNGIKTIEGDELLSDQHPGVGKDFGKGAIKVFHGDPGSPEFEAVILKANRTDRD
ncbi:MAG: hypothetical protein ABJA67_17130, partial [Chthonomonadales bacterium]